MADTARPSTVARWAYPVAWASLAGLLVYAGVTKALEPWAFFGNLRLYGFGTYPSAAIAVVLPVLEITVGGLLAFPRTRSAALLLAMALGVAFVAVQIPVLAGGRSVPCGCLGSSQPVSGWTLARAVLFLGTATWAFSHLLRTLGPPASPRLEPGPGPTPTPQGN